MLGKMVLTLLIAWALIIAWKLLKRWGTPPDVRELIYGPQNRKHMIICHYCGAMEELDRQSFERAYETSDKLACTKCKEGGKDAADRARCQNRANGT